MERVLFITERKAVAGVACSSYVNWYLYRVHIYMHAM